MEPIKEFSLHIAPAAPSAKHGRPLRQRAILWIDKGLAAERGFVEERYASLCGLLALRLADANRYEPLPESFPVLVAPIATVRPYGHEKHRDPGVAPTEDEAREAVANGIEIVFDPERFGEKPLRQEQGVREFCAAIADFLIQPEGSPYSVPTPREPATVPVAAAGADAA